MRVSPSKDDFLHLAQRHRMVPVATEILGDRDTPVSVFEKVAGADPAAFLLESVEGGERWARWSFVGWDPLFVLTSRAGTTTAGGAGIELSGLDPLSALERVVSAFDTPVLAGLPPLHSGLVGYLAYDAVRYVEHLANRPPDDRGLPEMVFQAVGTLAAVDRFRQTITVIRNVVVGADPADDYDTAVAALHRAVEAIGRPGVAGVRQPPSAEPVPPVAATFDRPGFEAAVRRAKGEIEAGEAFQIVPSLRLEVDFEGDPFSVYRVLRLINPSPFMFFVRTPELAVAGSSPELLARVRDGRVYSRPIAGTRRRGVTPEDDDALSDELLADPKERAEHVMLIDLARNDLGRVCEYSSVGVDDLMVIERYSHVMHIVSGVSGTLRAGLGPVDVLRATFPHGTVSGAPKIRAMEIIDELEPVARGPYAGAVGYIDFSGNLDLAIALRTMVASGSKAWVQAGAGIVADSIPSHEYDECMAKAAAVLAAIGGARDV